MFSELYARSSFSFLRGASHPEGLIQRAAELNYESIAILDHMGVYGSVRAHLAARRHGIRALVGATVRFPGSAPGESSLEVPILVDSITGYQNLCRLLTELHCNSEEDLARVLRRARATSNCLPYSTRGMVALLTSDSFSSFDRRDLLKIALLIRRTFGKHNVYITLTRDHSRGSNKINRLFIDLSRHLDLPLLASNAPLYAHRHNRLLADCFTCLRHHTTLDEAGSLLATNLSLIHI